MQQEAPGLSQGGLGAEMLATGCCVVLTICWDREHLTPHTKPPIAARSQGCGTGEYMFEIRPQTGAASSLHSRLCLMAY